LQQQQSLDDANIGERLITTLLLDFLFSPISSCPFAFVGTLSLDGLFCFAHEWKKSGRVLVC
jgi:hypothetical protein